MGGTGSTVGAVLGGVGGFALGGPVGAGLGMSAGALLGGAFDDDGSSGYVDPAQYQAGIDAANARAAIGFDPAMANQDYAAQAQWRGSQQAEAARLQAILEGRGGPSLAEQQMAAGQEAAARNAINLAASTRGGGGNQLQAARMAQTQNLADAQATRQQAGMLRAQEQQQAGQQLQQLMYGARGQDLSTRSTSLQQAQYDTQRQLESRAQNDALAGSYLAAMSGATSANAQRDAARQQASSYTQGALIQGGAGFAGTALASQTAQQNAAAAQQQQGATSNPYGPNPYR